jgi:hypothetical protein
LQERFWIHEIGRIDGGRRSQTSGNMFQIGGNTFCNQKNKILMKILEFKRSGIRIIAEFRWILNEFPNQASEFLLTELQIEHSTTLPQYIVQNHIKVVNHNGTFYHLNPNLVFDVNQIVLCRVCAENPMTKDQESIAAGNDYV